MGFFSWRTQDTDRSIPNVFSDRTPFKVVMVDDKGNKYVEENYNGYGEFGGKDFYELLDEMNGGKGDRMAGIDLAFNEEGKKFISPSLSEAGWYCDGDAPENCDAQGYFYDGE
jgi:hypothetical protein